MSLKSVLQGSEGKDIKACHSNSASSHRVKGFTKGVGQNPKQEAPNNGLCLRNACILQLPASNRLGLLKSFSKAL